MTGRLAVAFDMTFADRNRGGSWVYSHSLLDALRARDDTDCHLVSARAGAGLATTMRWLADGARAALRGMAVDLLHCPAFVCPWRMTLPYVATIPDALARRFPGDHPLEWRVYERRLLGERARAAAFVLTGTGFSRTELIETYGLRPERVVVTPLGVDRRFGAAGWRRAGPPGDPPRLLFPGAPLGRKNLPAVLRAMAAGAGGTALGRAVLEISGAAAPEFPEQAGLVSSLGLAGRVRWLGQVEADRMPALMAGVDVVVYPSLHEGFGLPPLEAMTVGTPVVASNASCLPEVYGEGALLLDATDPRQVGRALESVLTRPELRERLRERGREVAAGYTWERCAEATRAVYAEVHAMAGAAGSAGASRLASPY
jgi:glycosyltransferase involved in cell wall biosynthesis